MSESDTSSITSTDVSDSAENSSSDGEVDIGSIEPYQDEPLASENDSNSSESENLSENDGPDNIPRIVLERRFERTISVQDWCTCDNCSDQHLVGSLEFRCCKEVGEAIRKYTFEGLEPECIITCAEYNALTEIIVLEQVGPLLKRRDGRYMRREQNTPMNEYLRAVGYRFIIRWLCGTMGWDNTLPLPACIYHNLRERFAVQGAQTGYLLAGARE
ncbi:uncharacterized protein LOC114535438 [Dendronephthya gigantea]|uniref:uncharacterized protein LOC114535438 n=1 Tax=Dendronephthya gigantea TaxID=151771 RepID=UPI001069143D|nr:uncharacterized protein LOC114535438 [Dendronephthya gigantea]